MAYKGPAITTPPPLGVAVIVICTVFPFLAAVAVGLRFYARRVNAIRLKADDWIILPALVGADASPSYVVDFGC